MVHDASHLEGRPRIEAMGLERRLRKVERRAGIGARASTLLVYDLGDEHGECMIDGKTVARLKGELFSDYAARATGMLSVAAQVIRYSL